MRHKKLHISIILVLLMSWVPGCVIEEPRGDNENTREGKIRFELFTKADSYGLPVTRATANEDAVDKTPWVLVFLGTDENATFVEAVQAEKVGIKSFVTLTPQTTACQLLVLANPESKFYIGTTAYDFSVTGFNTAFKSTVRTLSYVSTNMLSMPLAASQSTVPFVGENIPMNDLVSVTKIDPSITIPQIKLKRTVGKVVVGNTDTKFTFKGITAVGNTPKQTRSYSLDGLIAYNTGAGKTIEYRTDAGYTTDICPAVGNTTESNPVYMYESECDEAANDTYLIVRGRRDGDTEDFFYKMAFVDNNVAQLDILRNCEYTFTITAVNGPGYSTVADAKASKASNTNLQYTILVQDNSGYEIVANNDYYVGVTNSHLELYARQNAATQHTAFTLITNCKRTFADKRSVVSLTPGLTISSPAGGIIPTNTTTPCDVKIKVENTFTSGEIEIHLGNLKKTITVRRNAQAPSGTVIKQFYPDPTKVSYVSASVVGYPMNTDGTPKASYWLQLAPGGKNVRNDPHQIYVDDGLIDLRVGSGGTGAIGNVYVSTKNSPVRRIKVLINQ